MHAFVSRSAETPLAWEELPSPKLGPRDLRVEVGAVGVNPVDWKMRGPSFLGFAYAVVGPGAPFVPGVDFAGVVRAAGPEADVAVGARVVGGTDFSRKQRGSFADEVTVRCDQVVQLPDHVPLEVAACLPVPGVTAWRAVHELGRLRPGGKCLVLGASGGVGHLCVQIAREAGAEVVGVCSARNAALVSRLGARVVDYGEGEVLTRAGGPFDLIVDAVGSHAYPVSACLRKLTPGGVHVLVMPTAGDGWRLALPGRVKTILGRPDRATIGPVVEAVAQGKLEVVLAERVPMAQAEAALRRSAEGRVAGKLVLVREVGAA